MSSLAPRSAQTYKLEKSNAYFLVTTMTYTWALLNFVTTSCPDLYASLNWPVHITLSKIPIYNEALC